ncbi:DUF4209 domain-containing protein [Nocardia farcinica]
MPNVLLSNRLPRFTTSSGEHLDQQNVARFAQTTAEFNGRLMAEALRRVAERYGRPGGEDLTTYLLALGAIDTRLARSLAKGFGYFWSGDYEACAAVVIPKIETAARALLRELDEPTYQVQVSAAKAGGHILLHPLLEPLENVALDEDWAYFLRWLLSGPTGKNLRNDYAHGHIDEVTPADAALLLRAAALLITAAPIADDLIRRVEVVPGSALPTRSARIAESLLTRAAQTAAGLFITAEKWRLDLRARHQRNCPRQPQGSFDRDRAVPLWYRHTLDISFDLPVPISRVERGASVSPRGRAMAQRACRDSERAGCRLHRCDADPLRRRGTAGMAPRPTRLPTDPTPRLAIGDSRLQGELPPHWPSTAKVVAEQAPYPRISPEQSVQGHKRQARTR